MMKKLLATAVMLAGIAGAPLVVSAEEITLNAVTLTPKKAGIARGFKQFFDKVNEKFSGELKIRWRGGPEVVPSFKQAESVRLGAMDMTITSPSYYAGLVPPSSTMNLSFKSYDDIRKTGYYERMTEIHADKGLVFLGEVPATKVQFYIFLKDPIKGLEDLKGRRIRVFPTVLPMIEKLGATPLVLPIGEIYTAMERGAIDGFVRGKTGWPEQFKGVVHHVVTPGVYRAGFPVLVNDKSWSKLPEDLQKRVMAYVRDELSSEIDAGWDAHVAQGDEQMAKAGFNVIELTGEEKDRYFKLVLDAAWEKVGKDAGEEIAGELHKMLVE
jgi:TRAP-type C4-dicarboxylate transport system substrate-binding protein